MPISLTKAIKSTHRHPINRILHCIGAPIYITGIALIVNSLVSGIRFPDLEYAIIMCCTAVALFLIGHRTEGNLRAMTLILLYKYIARSIKTMGISSS
jgi:phosphate starvation-inducible membrane PsiE